VRSLRSAFIVTGVLLMLGSTVGTVAGASPAAVWHLDETSGSVMHDGSGHGHDGTLKNIQLGAPGIGGTKGYQFNGRSSVILVPDSAGLNAGTADMVVTVHVAFDEAPEDDYDLIRKGLSSTAGGDWKIEIVNVDGRSVARCYLKGPGGSWQKTTGPDLADGVYHTITCEKHATTVSMSVDGTVWKKTKALGTMGNKAVLSIGAKAEGGDWYEGTMDEISIVTGS
jgi:hypothetical protein